MYYKCELVVGGYSYDVTNNLVNWDDVEMSFKRNDYDGVVRSFSTKFQFANGAYSLLLKQYTDNYLKSNASIVFYIRNNSWLWNEKFRCALDFSTFSYNGTTCEINAVDDSLASLIKAKKGTQYEYPVIELMESTQLYYDRLIMLNSAKWYVTGETMEDESMVINASIGDTTLPIYLGNPEIQTKNIVEIYDVQQKAYSSGDKNYEPFLKCISSEKVNAKITGNFYFNTKYESEVTQVRTVRIYLRKEDGSDTIVASGLLPNGGWNVNINTTVELQNNSVLYCLIDSGTNATITVTRTSHISVEFYGREKPINIYVIKPVSLINRLLTSINGEKEGVTCEIVSGVDSRLDNTLIVSAESIRGIEDAKIYTSYTKFVKWMEAEFGFVPVVGENKVTFVHRDSLFQDVQIKDFTENSREFEYSVNSSLIYSSIKVGYDKQDYDSVNGRDEFHFTNEYLTGITLTDNVLDLISPYRADAYGIEFLAAKRGEDTTDSKSDNDIFFVGAELSGDKYELIRIPISGVISPDTMFNAMYSQHHMIKANEKFIGAFTDRLEFASSEGNSDVVIDGVSEKADILISERSFTVGELSFETGDTEIPSDLSGYVVVTNGGKTYKGYLSNVSYNLGRSEAVKYTLIAKEAQ